MYNIRVPASTANLGAGFDSIGLAFNLYNYLQVSEQDGGLTIVVESPSAVFPPGKPPASPSPDFFPMHGEHEVETDERNLIYRAYRRFFDETGKRAPHGVKMIQRDNIPQSRGLGSSAACIAAGLLAANALSGGGVDLDEIARLAALMEGHPDNSTAAVFGGLIVGVLTGRKLEYVKLDSPGISELAFAAVIPEFILPTVQARDILPESYPRADAVFNISRAALTVAAFASGDFSKLTISMDDRIHQPYRLPLVRGMTDVFSACKSCGAEAAFLSGAGPAVMAVLRRENAGDFRKKIAGGLNGIDGDWAVKMLEVDTLGATVEKV